jgi:SAM-dependent methyltransferase
LTRQSGALRIFLYNWPVYVGSWLASFVLVLVSGTVPEGWRLLVMLGAGVAVGWSLVSLLVSRYVYDHSALVPGKWLPSLLPAPLRTWATVHAGLDAEVDVDAALGAGCVARLDIFDAQCMTSPSIVRARTRTPRAHLATPCRPTALSLGDAACDAVVVAFTAHEIRDRSVREQFFEELRRAVRPGGRVLVVEHLRDVANFAAFGPGFLHFLPQNEWRRLAAHARLTVASETRITPWVMALALERPL